MMRGISSKDVARIDSALQDVFRDIETIKESAEAYKEGRSEKWCESEAGEAYEDRIERLDSLLDDLTGVCEEFLNIVQGD